ncbi:MAG: succinate--CoA ligase subunit beta [Chloroflexi bacterium 13_1_20CM_54_36]|nr:MAG: succinate--CoA ligase subunit beta [Ktedonobacter sp. 13_2_20CM_53_11]OLB57120.1 MAG: succinate--CoA ligase subunit beta [Ktedonobacter sp. 13_2_20CM_2_56_8]OLD84014.1 MAG: succinate--CoA ligase subunit beta [Chloroflexi bacterium 13_1_20CM_54_36]OLE08084.1 MAG: succinate--CoA ligase subunit beta [Ktedonobacter sp. 13_1_20CM_4_53_11]OLE36175.1 MAG: succinate--CoA ligase subunit beta [Ktedonobacter sp. 13_1_20CM_3_54_15]TMB83835.1 MAG: ADP-forming succinate--CoA ligase subunit beta [Chl
MKIHEYQAKDILAHYGVPIQPGRVAYTPDEAEAIARELGGPVVIKAQVYVGGRGKAGGIQFGDTPEQARAAASKVLGMDIKGLTVEKVLVVSKINIQEEYYLGIILDRKSQAPIVMVSKEGGIDIEEVAAKTPEKIIKQPIDMRWGLRPFEARDILARARLPHQVIGKGGSILTALARAFIESDASLAEINPLVLTSEGQVQAADAKILIDDNGLFRQKEYASWAESEESNPLEYEARQEGLTYVKLDGNVGIIGNGAGLVMTTLDMVARVGGKPANFLDIGGGAKAEVMYKALSFVARDPQVKGILVNIFGGITRGEEVAKGVIMAQAELPEGMPIVVRLSGTGAEEGKALLKDAGLDWGKDMREAAQKIVAAVG